MRINRRLTVSNWLKTHFLLLGLAALAACNLLSPTTSSTVYNEDLSVHRPEIVADTISDAPSDEVVRYVEPTHDQNNEIDQKLDEITRFNKTSNTAQGFTIQVYSGTSREQASEVKTQIYKILPDLRPVTRYEQPIYRVRVGEFIDRLEAQNTYAQLVQEFPQAIVIPTRIRIN